MLPALKMLCAFSDNAYLVGVCSDEQVLARHWHVDEESGKQQRHKGEESKSSRSDRALVQTHLALISAATEQLKQWGSVVPMGRRLQTACRRLRCARESTRDAAAPNTRSSSRDSRDRRCLQPLQWPTWNWCSWEELRCDLLMQSIRTPSLATRASTYLRQRIETDP